MNGALTLHIPLYSLPQRGRLSLSFSLVANTTVFSSTQQDGCTLTGCYTISANGYTGFPQTGASSLVRLVMDQQLALAS